MRWPVAIAVMGLLVLSSCRKEAGTEPVEDAPFALQLPPGFPLPVVPADNPLTQASVELGKALFFDPRLSRDGTVSCASCHLPSKAFSDPARVSVGIEGRTGFRNSPSLGNVGYHAAFFRDGGVPTLEQQVIAPIHDVVEMDHDINRVAALLRDEERYRRLSRMAYGRELDAWVVTRAIANYERTLVSGWSRYDRYQQGDLTALTEQELRGLALFTSEELNCTSCHGGFDLSDHGYHNVGQYLDYTLDPGRGRITLRPEDEGRFKTPSLRNVALTAPYMHDGSMPTLKHVIDHFASGGLPHPNRDPEMRTFTITEEEKADLIAFLGSLTDERSLDQLP